MPEKHLSKRSFVLAHPKKTASEIVALAKSQGMDLSPKYVYVIRSQEKANKPNKKARVTPKPLAKVSSQASKTFLVVTLAKAMAEAKSQADANVLAKAIEKIAKG